MTRHLDSGLTVAVLSLAVIMSPAATRAVADELITCDDTEAPHPIPEAIPAAQAVWTELDEVGNGPERVAIVVWHDPTEDPPDGLYALLQPSIDAYAQDVADAGFTVTVVKFYGMAEDPFNGAETVDLRRQLTQMWQEQQSLAGAVLVGNVPYLLFEYDSGSDVEDYVSDSLIADLDGGIADLQSDDPWREGVFDQWDISVNDDMEIWISRIRARPALVDYFRAELAPALTQEDILNEYFTRNSANRWNAFNSSGEALFYACDETTEEEGVVPALQQLFGDTHVTSICPPTDPPEPEPTVADYLDRLEYGYAHIHLHACHGMARTQFTCAVERADYTYRDRPTMSYVFESCSNCDLAYARFQDGLGSTIEEAASLGEVAVFNPQAPTLVALGGTKPIHLQEAIETYYSVLPQGRCLGEGLKELFNHLHDDHQPPLPPTLGELGYVLLGDGTLKRWGEIVEWDAGDTVDRWSFPDNWSMDQLPMPTDNVLHDTDHLILMDRGSVSASEKIWDFDGDGALGGSLYFQEKKHLELGGDALLTNDYAVTLEAGPNEDWPTQLTVWGDILGGDFTLNDYTKVTAGTISGCVLTVSGEGSAVITDTIGTSTFEVTSNARVQAPGGITGVSASAEFQDWTIDHGFVVVGPSTLWGDWTISGVADGEDWSVLFEQMSANAESGISMTLQDDAVVEITRGVYGEPQFPDNTPHELLYGIGLNKFGGQGSCPLYRDWLYFGDHTCIKPSEEVTGLSLDLVLHSELHIAGDFVHPFVYEQWDTRNVDVTADPMPIGASPDGTQPIELISPDFTPWFPQPPRPPPIFLDAPCHGSFRDLTIPGLLEPNPYVAAACAKHSYNNSIIDEGDNSKWPNLDREVSGPPEAGFFRDVSVGPWRTLMFEKVSGVIYYYGARTIDDDATLLYWPEGATEPVEVDGPGAPTLNEVIVPAEGTVYGDWNGDCVISNAELGALREVIFGGSAAYNPLMDQDCDGEVKIQPELVKFLINMNGQPPSGGGGGAGAGGDGGGSGGYADGGPGEEAAGDPWESYEYYYDVAGLAAWLTEVLPADELDAFVADLAVAVDEFADTPVGWDLAELLCQL